MGWGERNNGRSPFGAITPKPRIPMNGGAPPGVPILGQPFEITGLVMIANLTCKCEGRHPLLVMSNAPAQCPACKKAYLLAGVQVRPGELPQIQVSISAPPNAEPAEAPPADSHG